VSRPPNMMELLKRVRQEKREEKEGGDKDKTASTTTTAIVVVERDLGVRFCKATEVEELRAAANVWHRGQGAAYTLNDDHVVMRLTTTVSFARALGNTHAIKLRGVSDFGVERYQHEGGMTLNKINGIADGAEIIGTYRIDEKTGDDFTHSHADIAAQILGA